MKKIILIILLAGVTLSFISSSTYGWVTLTANYITRELCDRKWSYWCYQKKWGSIVTDVVNLKNISATGPPPYQELYEKLHLIAPGSLNELGTEARWCSQKSAFFGMASHSDNFFGADWTAHHDARTLDPEFPLPPPAPSPPPNYGYVTIKSALLIPDIIPQLCSIGLTLDQAQAFAPMVADFAVETAVDLLVRNELAPLIGLDVYFAASVRSVSIPYMLARAFSGSAASASEIIALEREFREMMKFYGLIFLQEDPISIIIAQLLPELAENLGIDISEIEDSLITLGVAAVNSAIADCKGDYQDEIMDTITYVRDQLAITPGIQSCP